MMVLGRKAGVIGVCALFLAGWTQHARAADTAPPIQRPAALASASDPALEEPAAVEEPAANEPTPEPTSSKAPATRKPTPSHNDVARDPTEASTPTPTKAAPTASGVGLKKRSKRKDDGKFPHRGFATDFRIGTQGCVRTICSAGRHDAKPGFRLDGFVGGNIRGWVELGVAAGWGTLSADVEEGTNALRLYGIDPNTLARVVAASGGQLDFNVNALAVSDTKLRTARAGPHLRVHFIPRGRYAAWVGTGLGYSLFRAKYVTNGGDVRLDFHGLDVPIEAGFAVHVHRNVAVAAQFNYLWAWYGLASIRHPDQRATIPLSVLDDAVATQDVNLKKDLPQLWTLGFGVRVRI